MNAQPHLLHPAIASSCARRAMLLVALLVVARASLAATVSEAPEVWTKSPTHETITTAAVARTLEGDEVWENSSARHQLLDTGGATRTITLPPIGADGVAIDGRYVARVSTRVGDRILFRRADGELIAFWGTDNAAETKWIELTAHPAGWKTCVSPGHALGCEDPRLAVLGAHLQEADGYFRPAATRTQGFALRFQTTASLVYVNCRANSPAFRVAVNGVLVATVQLDDRSGRQLRIPVDLGPATTRGKQVEILADALEFAGIETPNANDRLEAWASPVPAVRLLWIGDDSVELGTRAYPWLAGKHLNHHVWCRSWGHHAQHVAGPDRSTPPLAAMEEDITEVDPDVLVISGHFFDGQLAPKEYAEVVGAWFDAISQAARADTVTIVLSPSANRGPMDRVAHRQAAIIGKEAKRRGFSYVNGQDWIEGKREDPTRGNAHLVVSEDLVHYTEFGNAYIAGRFVEQLRRLRLQERIQVVAEKRQDSAASARSLAATNP